MSRRVVVLIACFAGLVMPAAAAAEPVVAEGILGTNGAPVPELDWGVCPAETPEEAASLAEYECTVAEVPLSYRDPNGQSIELALGRLPATDQANKLGSLFWNPGGPGGSGRIPPPFSEALRERFDLVGFDPRGIAASTPLRCFRSNEQAIRLFGWDFPITPAQEQDVIRKTARGTDLCARRGGPILEHMSTANVARDLDLLRQAVGDPQLSYLGFSYGSAIGEYYANLFPDNVRAVALDAVIDPREWVNEPGAVPPEFTLGSFFGTNQALNTFLAECAIDPRCAFREPGVDLRRKYDRLLARVRRSPVVVALGDEEFVATYQAVVYATFGLLYLASNSPELAAILQLTWEATARPAREGDPPAAASGSPTFVRTAPAGREDEPYLGLEWGPAVQCTDTASPANPWLWPRYARLADRLAGPFGSAWMYFSLPCATWPARDPDRYTGPWDRETANPILLVGNRLGDPATPYEDAQATQQLLADARLLTLDTFGHVARRGISRCIDELVDRYLIALELPAEGTVCQPDRRPFDPLPEGVARRLREWDERVPPPLLPEGVGSATRAR